jgi:gamma-glutamylcyclotransferase
MDMLYFAYGSNMCTGRLRARDRVPSAEFVRTAKLAAHVFRFHKRSKKDCSAKADAYFTGNAEDVVWGVVFKVNPAEKPQLDEAEGLGYGYAEKEVKVIDVDGKGRWAVMYVAEKPHIQEELCPYTWYKRFVIEGARQHGLPADYVARIEAMPAVEDPDRARVAENRTIKC